MSDYQSVDEGGRPVSGWATGGVIFAAAVMIMLGVFQAIQGLAAIINDEFYVVVSDYAFNIDVSAWGWIHLIAGVLVAIAGFALLSGSAVAGVVAIALAGLSAVANFLFVPYYPFWSLLMIGLAVYVIWAVSRSGTLES